MKMKNPENLFTIIVVFLIGWIGVSLAEAFEYFPHEVGDRWVYSPSYGDGNRVDTILGTETIDGTLTQVWKREESAPDNYHEKRWMAGDGEYVRLYKIWSNMDLNPSEPLNPPMIVGKLNPQVGETSCFEIKFGGIEVKITSYVESVTDVMSVPAGTFNNCMVIREMSEITLNGVTEYDYERTWYAPDVGPIAYRSYSRNWETIHFSQELVRFSNAGNLHIDINMNQDVYESGDTLKAFTSIYNAGVCQMADIYIVARLSDGTIFFYPEFTETVKPVLADPINICGSPFLNDYTLIEAKINENFPKGDHAWYAVLNSPGTNVLDTNNWLSFDEAPFTVK